MEKLSMCRICVSGELPLRSIVNTHLHEIYESLTKKPFVTESKHPIVACDPCCASLEDCYELRKRCLSSEERFTQLLTSNAQVNQPMLPATGRKRPSKDVLKKRKTPSKDALKKRKTPLKDVLKKIENKKVKEKQAEAARADNCAHPDAERTEDVASTVDVDTACRYIKVEIDIEHEISDESTGEQDDVEVVAAYTAPGDHTDDIPQHIGNEESHSDAGAPVAGQHIPDTQLSREATYASLKTSEEIFEFKMNADQSADSSYNIPLPYSCVICKKCFSVKKQLTRHMHTHTGDKPFKCTMCEKCFNQKSQLGRHILIHTGEKPYQCNLCTKRFLRKSCLHLHLLTHTGEKPYHCKVCNKSFNRQGNLDVHIRTHTGDKPYECDICKQCFIRKREFNVHIRSHTGEKPYQCNMCEKSFNRKDNLDVHVRTHTGEKPYECNVCKKCYNRKDHLDDHLRTHTGEKPYVCNMCDQCFLRKHELTVHIRTHTGEKPHQCYMCKRCFSRKDHLDRHIYTHTSEKP